MTNYNNFLISFQIYLLSEKRRKEKEDRDMYALQKCKVLRDYENAPWQPLWLSSKEFMTAVGTMEDLHIFFFKQMKRVWSRGKWTCIMQATFWYNNYMSNNFLLVLDHWLAPSQPHKTLGNFSFRLGSNCSPSEVPIFVLVYLTGDMRR